MRIDCHVHNLHAERNEQGILIPPLMSFWSTQKISPEEMIRENHAAGIEKVVLLDPPDLTFPIYEQFKEFVIPIPQVEMDRDPPERIHDFFRRGAKGIKFIAPEHPYSSERYFPFYQTLADLKGLAVFHTGYLIRDMYGPGAIKPRDYHIDIETMRPSALDKISRVFPSLKILMAHFGNPWWEEAWEIVHCNPRIYADLSGGSACLKSLNMWRELLAPNGKLAGGVVEKLCYGSDGCPFSAGACNCSRMQNFYDALYDALKLPEELRSRIDRENILFLTA